MDKRWLGILIILIAGLGCMYLIVDSSPTVGKAVSVIDEMTITLPDGFNILKEKKTELDLKKGNDTVNITIIGMGNNSLKEYKSQLKLLKNNPEIEIKDTINNETGNIILYKNITSDKEISITYFVKDNRTISVKMNMYDNWETDLNFIVDTTQHNFKQNTYYTFLFQN